MVQAYSPAASNEPDKAVAAQEIVTETRPTSRTFANLAVLAYQAGQTRKGDLARQQGARPRRPADRAHAQVQHRPGQAAGARDPAPERDADADRHGVRQKARKSGG